MSTHTPGPWIVATSNSWRRIVGQGFTSVCEPIVQRDGHPDLHFQNGGAEGPDARLIAAAPDLLDALEAAKRKHHVCEDCWYSCPASGECCDDAESDQCNCGAEQHNAAIDAAIAKARGQS